MSRKRSAFEANERVAPGMATVSSGSPVPCRCIRQGTEADRLTECSCGVTHTCTDTTPSASSDETASAGMPTRRP